MKTKPLTKEIAFLMKTYETYERVGDVLDVTPRYVRMLEKGHMPGKRLYRDILMAVAYNKK